MLRQRVNVHTPLEAPRRRINAAGRESGSAGNPGSSCRHHGSRAALIRAANRFDKLAYAVSDRADVLNPSFRSIRYLRGDGKDAAPCRRRRPTIRDGAAAAVCRRHACRHRRGRGAPARMALNEPCFRNGQHRRRVKRLLVASYEGCLSQKHRPGSPEDLRQWIVTIRLGGVAVALACLVIALLAHRLGIVR
jgi:hypothetical protein